MAKILDELNNLRSKVKDMVTADNTEAIAELTSHIDTLENEFKEQDKKMSEYKDKIVDIVKSTSFKEKPKDDIIEEHKSLDDIMADNLDKIIKARK